MIQELPFKDRPIVPIIKDELVEGVWPQFMKPYPLSEKYFLVACKLPTLTVTVAIPFFFAVIFPLESTDTTDESELLHEAPVFDSLHLKRQSSL